MLAGRPARVSKVIRMQCSTTAPGESARLPTEGPTPPAPEVVARHKNRAPRTKTRNLWDALLRILKPYDVISVRGAYYQAEMAGLVGKTEADYDCVQRALLAMRRAGVLPYAKICDNARERRSIYQYGGLGAALEDWHR